MNFIYVMKDLIEKINSQLTVVVPIVCELSADASIAACSLSNSMKQYSLLLKVLSSFV